MDAIVAATANAADLMRLAGAGRLRAGGAAALLAVAGDPLHDMSVVADRSHHLLVMKGGEAVFIAANLAAARPPAAASEQAGETRYFFASRRADVRHFRRLQLVENEGRRKSYLRRSVVT